MSNASPSAGTPTRNSSGQCVVCGESTWTRCSECAKFGTDWMYFCSTNHQRLVWELHKRVCGIRSNPFQWPGFTDDEIVAFAWLLEQPLYLNGDGPAGTVGDVLAMASNNDATALKSSLLRAHSAVKDPGHQQRIPPALASKIAMLRERDGQILFKIFSSSASGDSPTMAAMMAYMYQPFNAMVGGQGLISPGLISKSNEYRDAPWWSTYQHKNLISVAVFREGADTEASRAHFEYTRTELVRFIREVIAPTHPNLALTLYGPVAQLVMSKQSK